MGDSDIFELYRELTGQKLTYDVLLQEADILTNLYYHLIRDGSKAIRIPSLYCYQPALERQTLAHKAEQIINLLVSSVKKAIEKTEANILSLGVISYDSLEKGDKFWQEINKHIAKKTILLTDFGVDAIFIESIKNWEVLKNTLITIQEQTAQPLAPFFALQNFQKNQLSEYLELYHSLQLEMLGVEIEPLDLLSQKKTILRTIAQETSAGFLLKNFQSSKEMELVYILFQEINPTAIFAGSGVTRKWWNNFCQKYFG